MKRSLKVFALITGVLVMATALPAFAATPSSATLSATKKSITFKGGPFQPTDSFPYTDCALLGPDSPGYDSFDLKVNMGEGAKFKIAVKSSPDPTGGIQQNDIDLCVFAPDGTVAGDSGSSTGTEQATITHKAKFRNKPYAIRVNRFLLFPNATYKGTASIVLFRK